MNKKRKNLIITAYIFCLATFLYLIFKNFTIDELISLEFLLIFKELFLNFSNNNLFFAAIHIIVISILWAFFLGFTSPIAIFCGMIFGNAFGTLIALLGLTIGSTVLYLIGRYFFSRILSKLFKSKYNNIRGRFHSNELIFFIFYRIFIGIPFGLSNLIAVIFNIKLFNYFFGTLIGIFPSVFIWVSIGNGFDKLAAKTGSPPNYYTIISSPETKYTLIVFFTFFIILIISKIYINRRMP